MTSDISNRPFVVLEWGHLLDVAVEAALRVGATTDPLEPDMRRLDPRLARPSVFDPDFMRALLDSDELTAFLLMRRSAGFGRCPDNRAEAEQLLGPGCRTHGRRHFLKLAQATRPSATITTGRWDIGCCCDCGHPFLRYTIPSGALHWSLYPDLL
ncbi:hypothetical protein [Nocardia bovistercoris]|uniref:Uncharacterized protein n=1 Tax=Nocardia bovistercoris TaxID=2785916 RepID=A0A931IIK5_9NOCA|nr:hypothetical protein [Nocardia bovistercoris]MBH0780340.1 hypothetical protein [Nocardia bovistercoris]